MVSKKGLKNVNCVSGENNSNYCFGLHGGTALPPMVIFGGRKTLNPDLTTGEIPGTLYGLSEKGWMNRELFLVWFYEHFLALIPPGRPVLLLLDGHSSHYSPDLNTTCSRREGIIILTSTKHNPHFPTFG